VTHTKGKPHSPAKDWSAAVVSVAERASTLHFPHLSTVLEQAHRSGVSAATVGLQDAGLGELRLTGPGVATLAEAAVSSATPFLRAPLLARMSAVLLLHPVRGDASGRCPTCQTEAPCQTSRAVHW
jgi:hypothetical protein